MPRDPRAYLWDAREAGSAIQTFVAGMDARANAASALVQSATERQFEIIGEALNQLAKADPGLAVRIPGLAQIVSFRNQLMHAYASVNSGTVWNVLHQSLASLLVCLQGLLEELDQQAPDL